MRIVRVEGRSDLLGRVRVRLPPGLVGVVGREASVTAAFADLLRNGLLAAGEARPDASVRVELERTDRAPALPIEDLTTLWMGALGGEDPGEVLEAAARALAGIRGGARLDRAARRVARAGVLNLDPGPSAGDLGASADADRDPSAAVSTGVVRERIEGLERGPEGGAEGGAEPVADLEERLQELRADHAEIAGDLEVASMDWLRERQDAETHLQAYRDRARELKARLTDLEDGGADIPCPTCGRVLHERFDEVVDELREEWESVVQDGSWWKRRREQLEVKPDALRDLESRSLRLQAAIEESAERLERARARERELRTRRDRPGEAEAGGASDRSRAPAGEEADADPAPTLLRALQHAHDGLLDEARDALLDAASGWVLRISGARLLGLSRSDGGALALEGVGARLADPSAEDRATAVVAVRLAAALLAEEAGAPAGTVVLGEPFDRMDPGSRVQTVDALTRLRDKLPHVLVLTRGEAVDLYPEAFEAVLDLAPDGGGAELSVRSLPAGVGNVRLG